VQANTLKLPNKVMAEEKGTPASEEKDIITLVDEKISSDADFQETLTELSQEEADVKITEKKAELIRLEYSTIAEKAKKDAELANNYKIRAEKAEKEAKNPPKPQEKTNDSQLSDELKLIAKGLSDEAIEKAKVIAKGKDISLTEAVKDPDFIVIQKDLDEKEKKEKAKLGASKGSGESEEEADVKSGMTREEHEKVFKKVLSR